MQTRRYKRVFLAVGLLTAFILAIQAYWNYELYKANKARYIQEYEDGFETAVDQYYYQQGESDALSILNTSGKDSSQNFFSTNALENLGGLLKGDSSASTDFSKLRDSDLERKKGVKIVTGEAALNRRALSEFKYNQISVRITRDSIDFSLLDSLLMAELYLRNLQTDYNIYHFKKDSVFDRHQSVSENSAFIRYTSDSEYIPRGQSLQVRFTSPGLANYLSSILGLLLSLLFSLAIIFVTFYFYRAIQRQRKLADIKDDFISNVTHEFKTPIATISAALEALQNFKAKAETDRTEKYLSLSREQLEKLNHMVDRLLETASLDEDEFELDRKETNITGLVGDLVEKYKVIHPESDLIWDGGTADIYKSVDAFYLRSAISNLIENALKYGGRLIRISVSGNQDQCEIAIFDNGGTLSASEAALIFDKFYRRQTGNLHDVKGYGIGLYFAKKIVEKHGGNLLLETGKQKTLFKIII